MRIVEPTKALPVSKKTNKKILLIAAILLVVCLFGLVVVYKKDKPSAKQPAVTDKTTGANSQPLNSTTATPEPAKVKKLRVFTGAEIKQFLDSFSYPNVSEIQDMPAITGNIEADRKIRVLTEAKGYRQRAIPDTSLVKIESYTLQQKAIAPWQALKTAAARDGIQIYLNEGFRSVDDQRQLFMARFNAAGGSAAAVAAGQQDALVNKLLEVTAIPGYSKHHTGFTVDIACGNSGDIFENTPCFTWLSKDNYINAKLAGWLPSYPDGAPAQGPNPEPWEYVWVGTDSLYE